MIIPNEEIVFIHIPKTGGTSIVSSFLEKIEDLGTIEIVGDLEQDILEKYMLRTHLKHSSAFSLFQENKNLESYYKFSIIRNPYQRWLSAKNYYRNNFNLNTMKSFVVDEQDNLIVDDIFHLSEIDLIFEKFNIKKSHMKKNDHKNKDMLTLSEIATIRNQFKDDFDFFGFDDDLYSLPTKNITWLLNGKE